MSTATVPAVTGRPDAAGKKGSRKGKTQRGRLHPSSRFFLAKAGPQGDVPVVGREIVDREHDPENLAKFEALKEGVAILEIVEWKPVHPSSRFFIAKAGPQGDVPVLGREIVDREHDPQGLARLILEIVEWRPVFDASGRTGTIGKEPVVHKKA